MAVSDELNTLRDLHTTLRKASDDIARVASDITTSLDNEVWIGRNSETFRDEWDDVKPTLTPRLVTALENAEEDVKSQHNSLAEATGENDRI